MTSGGGGEAIAVGGGTGTREAGGGRDRVDSGWRSCNDIDSNASY